MEWLVELSFMACILSLQNVLIQRAFKRLLLLVCLVKRNEPRHNKTNKVTLCPAKTLISLGIRPVWSESSLCAQWVAKSPGFLHADSEDSYQTGRMPRLIWGFAGRTLCWFCHEVAHFLAARKRNWNNTDLNASVRRTLYPPDWHITPL